MKVLYINTLYPPHIGGGAELMLEQQATAMAALGHSVTVLTIGPEPGVVAERRGDVSVLRVGYRNTYFHLSQVRPTLLERLRWHIRDSNNQAMAEALRDLVPKIAPDVACCHNLAGWSIAVWEELQRLQVPIVQVLHDHYFLCAKSTMFRSGQNCAAQCVDCRILRHGHAEASNVVSAVIGVSQFILNRLVTAGRFRNVPIKEVLYNVGSGALPALRPCQGKKKNLVLGFIGNLAENKGITVLLDAVQKSSLQDVRLRVAGRGAAEFDQRLRRTFCDPRIEFIGYVKPAEFFPSLDALVVPSLVHDSLPSVIFEALSYSVPVIGARRGGIPEMVQEGVNGLLFEPTQDGALAGAINSLYRQREMLDSLSIQAHSTARRFFDKRARTLREEEIFRRVVTNAADRPDVGAV